MDEIMKMITGFLHTVLSCTILVAIWYFASLVAPGKNVLPQPHEVLFAFYNLFTKYNLLFNMLYTIARVIAGFLVGIAIGFIIGIIVLFSRSLREFVYPIIVFITVTPSIAFIPLLIVWIGVNDLLPMVAVILCTSFPLAYAIISGSKSIDPEIIDVAMTLAGSKRDLIFRVMIPLMITHIASLLKYEVNHAWKIVFITEYLALPLGLGSLMYIAYNTFKIDEIIALIIIVGLLALTFQYIVELIESHIVRKWGFMK